MMATILNSAILNSTILDSAILHKTLTQTSSIWLKLFHSDSTWWWQPSWIHGHVGFRHCHLGLRYTCYLLSDSLKNTLHSTLTLTQTWFNLINLMMATILNSSILNSAILDSAILHKTLTQTSSIWLKLIHSDSTWWWQPSWILPFWIQTLPFCIQKPSVIFSQIWLKNTLTPFWLLTQTNSIWLRYSFIILTLMMAVILNSGHLLIQPCSIWLT